MAMHDSDPFGLPGEGHTFVKPTPGARGERVTQSGAGADIAIPEQGLNPLLALANRLLLAVPQIRQTARLDDPAGLRNTLAQGIREFSSRAQAAGIAPERIAAARYVLCTLLDEAASETPWGGGGVWARNGLLTFFHNESFGGDKVFQLMARLAKSPQEHQQLLELIYVALVLGFKGRYGIEPDGQARLDAVRDRLARILREQRGPYASALAQNWAVPPRETRRAMSVLPLAATAALTALLLGGAYLAATLSLSRAADPVDARIQTLRMASPWMASQPVAVAPPLPSKLATELATDIAAGWLTVREEADRSLVVLKGDGLFESGSAQVSGERAAVVARISQALARREGSVRVTGHTDNQAIASARFPSNWHLSEERARGVAQLLAANGLPADRVRSEGRGAAEPVAANTTPEQRALNRRVEIVLLTGRPLPATAVPAPAPAGPQPGART